MNSDFNFIDMNQVVRAMGALSPSADATVHIVNVGLTALAKAEDLAAHVGSSDPGITAWLFGGVNAASAGEQAKRSEIRGHLQYYRDNSDQQEAGFYDARNWTARAFVMLNASVQNSQDVDRIVSQFWSDAYAELKQLPEHVGSVVGDVGGWATLKILQGFLTTPFGMAVAAGLGYYAYRAWLKPVMRRL